MDGKPVRDSERMPTLEEVFEPWELAGESRRDCEPHRARLLRALARVSFLAGGLSIFCLLPALLGLPLGLMTRAMAGRDLDLISAGNMDHRGYHETEQARSDSHTGVILSLLGILGWFVVGAVLVLCILIAFWRFPPASPG
jgi:hypothetical protein